MPKSKKVETTKGRALVSTQEPSKVLRSETVKIPGIVPIVSLSSSVSETVATTTVSPTRNLSSETQPQVSLSSSVSETVTTMTVSPTRNLSSETPPKVSFSSAVSETVPTMTVSPTRNLSSETGYDVGGKKGESDLTQEHSPSSSSPYSTPEGLRLMMGNGQLYAGGAS